MTSGYTICSCRDCMEIAISNDDTKPELCLLCKEAGCTGHGLCRQISDEFSDPILIIRREYGTLDYNAVTAEAAVRRTQGGHTEYPEADVPVCHLCGRIDNPNVNPIYHPEFFLDE